MGELGWIGAVIALFALLLAVPLTWILYVDFGGHMIGDLIERPPWSRTVRAIQIVLVPVVAFLVWRLDFREFTYGAVAVFAAAAGSMWARTLFRGETWLWQRGGSRINAEWAGPIVLAGLSIGYLSSAINPWF